VCAVEQQLQQQQQQQQFSVSQEVMNEAACC
jgi:hypothetical protein